VRLHFDSLDLLVDEVLKKENSFMKFKALLAAALLILSVAPAAFAFDATETLSDFKIDGEIQETPNQIRVTSGFISFKSSKRGPVVEVLRIGSENTEGGATAICKTFGATKMTDYKLSSLRGDEQVLTVVLNDGKTEFVWERAGDTYAVIEIVCQK
jgi:hypothetical protein